jgi:hypothetical protein
MCCTHGRGGIASLSYDLNVERTNSARQTKQGERVVVY